MKKIIWAFLFSLFTFLAVSSVFANEDGALAGNFKLFDLNHKEYALSDYQGKQPVLLFFWTTWCPFCQAEVKNISGRAQELSGAGVEVLTIDIGEPKERIARFVSSHKINLTVLLDEHGAVSDSYGVLGVPTFYLLDKKGKIIFEGNKFPDNYKGLISGK